jgi:peptidoglycan/LPS O-acetylase OafA/YrhL
MSTAVDPYSAATTTRQFAGRFYRPELDVLRFFAFFGVFLFHAFPRVTSFYDANGIPRWLTETIIPVLTSGAYGVDLFFALSAYLITSLLLRERAATGSLDLRGFYLRRILRIWPLYLSFVAFAALVSLLTPAQHLPLRYIVGYSLLAGNWTYTIFGLPASFAIPLWTVSIEEQFYLTWPLAFRKASLRWMLGIAVGVLVTANVVRLALAASGASLQAMEYNTFARLDPIALGILVALAGNKLPAFSRGQRVALLAGGIGSWIAAAAFNGWHDPQNPETWRLAISHPVIALASVAVLLAFLGSQYFLFRNRLLTYLGKISYGLYVVHEFGRFCAANFMHPSTPLGVVAQSIVGLTFTVVIAAVSYRWLESPFLKLKERFSHIESRPV